MNYRLPTIAAILCSLTMSAGIWIAGSVVGASMARADGMPVSLADATDAPASAIYLLPGRRVIFATQCPRGAYFSEVSAYRFNGGALRGQHWNAHALRYEWRAADGRAVTFDGVTFRNHTLAPVIVAGWCE